MLIININKEIKDKKFYRSIFFKKIIIIGVLILFFGINIIPLTLGDDSGVNNIETKVEGIYYLRDDDPLNWEDVGSLLKDLPIENETTRCGMFVNFHFAQEGTYTDLTIINNIYYHFWQKGYDHGDYEIGYSTSAAHAAGFNESIMLDINDYITEVNGFRLMQTMQYTNPEIATFMGNDIYNFTIKLFGPNPRVLCYPHQYSFVIINLEDDVTLQSYDRDDDLLSDYDELFVYFTNPFDWDTDNDGYSDYFEAKNGNDPNNNHDPYEHNDQPNKPIITGPTYGRAGVEYEYIISSIDPDDNDLYYSIIWGDEIGENWIGEYSSGEEITMSHVWKEKGFYTIQVKAKDTNGAVSDLATLNVNIPRNVVNYNLLLLKYLDNFPLLKIIYQFLYRPI
jgi:hypothetical protein